MHMENYWIDGTIMKNEFALMPLCWENMIKRTRVMRMPTTASSRNDAERVCCQYVVTSYNYKLMDVGMIGSRPTVDVYVSMYVLAGSTIHRHVFNHFLRSKGGKSYRVRTKRRRCATK